ncbi:MAG: MotA/TolQ/ExbB proton channel family protein [Bacteroidetes bacterium]|jgi:chemotaxis protein MotA|nr:MotA/TolQ/ExbB proton channel family protein [Bacteroidota bacterium]
MDNRVNRILVALGISIALQLLIVAAFSFTSPEKGAIIHRFAVLLGGDIVAGGYIQFATFIVFFWGIFEIKFFNKWLGYERKYLNTDILPKEEHSVLGPKEVNSIRVKVLEYLNNKKMSGVEAEHFLLNLIKKAATKFRANHSADGAFSIVEAQSRINKEKSDSSQSHLRYILWAIPSIGFVGTVLGISQALSLANTNDINLITSTLGVAFDTTLLALVLSVWLMYSFHILQEKTENLHQDIEEFVVDNLINRIDVG